VTHEELRQACIDADARMKQDNGHSYLTVLKTRCQLCGRSPKQKGKCPYWFDTFLSHLEDVLRERGVVRRGGSA
jgi:hypothetical protein